MEPTGPFEPEIRAPFSELPHEFGRYLLVRSLGVGGMGAVYDAWDTRLERQVALKVPRHGAKCSEQIRTLYRNEFLLMSRIGARIATSAGKNICQLFDAGEVDDCPYFTMEFIPSPPGMTLRTYWEQMQDVLGTWGAVDLVERIARIVASVHRTASPGQSLVHRDLKPGNILVCQMPDEPEPRLVVLDFGLAVLVEGDRQNVDYAGGTFSYMPMEQMMPGWAGFNVTERTDVYSLGVVLFEMLAGERPFSGLVDELLDDLLGDEAAMRPSSFRPCPPILDEICLKATAMRPDRRYQSMTEFADALSSAYLEALFPRPGAQPRKSVMLQPRPLVARSCVRFTFVPYGTQAPPSLVGLDRLFLDVGNRLAEGILDHHHLPDGGPTARLVHDRRDLVDAAVNDERQPGDPFTIVLHQYPDLDAVAAVTLAMQYLDSRSFPDGIDRLIEYVDRVDAGESGLSLDRPFTLYSAFLRLAARKLGSRDMQPQELWRTAVQEGISLVTFALAESHHRQVPIADLDAFEAGVFTAEDREAVQSDIVRYRVKLADPRTHARRGRLKLQGRTEATVDVEALLVRNVQNASDPERVMYFKDWARTDSTASRAGAGFAALCVFMGEEAGHVRRCILSVTPGCGGSLKGLGAKLDEAESRRRAEVFGQDNRKHDPATGARLEVREGYDNADPWYDGRGHDFTIVDAPRSGTMLSADEIEAIFLAFGNASDVEAVKG